MMMVTYWSPLYMFRYKCSHNSHTNCGSRAGHLCYTCSSSSHIRSTLDYTLYASVDFLTTDLAHKGPSELDQILVFHRTEADHEEDKSKGSSHGASNVIVSHSSLLASWIAANEQATCRQSRKETIGHI